MGSFNWCVDQVNENLDKDMVRLEAVEKVNVALVDGGHRRLPIYLVLTSKQHKARGFNSIFNLGNVTVYQISNFKTFT